MGRPTDRDELLERATSDFERLMAAVDAVPVEHRRDSSDYPRGSVKDMLAHLDAWHRMFLDWERVGRTGEVAAMPAAGYTWKETPALNMEIHARYADDVWEDVVDRLRGSHRSCRTVIESYSDEELFTKRRYRWTGSTSVGSYAVSATTSHYDWALKHLRASQKAWAAEGGA